jgi:hypothetical protein
MKHEPQIQLQPMSRAALRARIGCAWDTLDKWIEQGCPAKKRGGHSASGSPVEWQFVFADVRRWYTERETARWLEHRRKSLVYVFRAMCWFCGRCKPDTEFVTHAVCKSCRAEHVAKFDGDELKSESI